MSDTFADIEAAFGQQESARIVLLPVPYDGTSTWGKGADGGPEAFLEAARNMELYDIETDSEVFRQGIYLAPQLEGFETPEAMVSGVEEATRFWLSRNQFVTLFGGEHSISIGSIRAFKEHFGELSVLQLDAHTDLRQSYQGTPYSHACAVAEAARTTNLVQVGIRSMDRGELEYMDRSRVFLAEEMEGQDRWMDDALAMLRDPLYITLDLDVFDPAIMPSTGTPEPGGLSWYSMLRFLRKVFTTRRVVGFDIVELCPEPANRAPDFLAAKLYYKMLSYRFSAKEQDG